MELSGVRTTPSRSETNGVLSAPTEREPRLNRGLVISVSAAAILLIFFHLGDYRTFGKHEGYVVVTAREMLESGDWIVPRFGGIPRLAKPPLAYWVTAASAKVFGGLNEATARIPAAVSSLLLAALVGLWGARWHGRMAGFGAGVVCISSLLVQTYARRAEVDMLLCVVTTAAMFLIADQPDAERGPRAFARWTGIYALLSVAWMAKFHYGPVMVLIPAFVHAAFERRWRMPLHAANPLGLAMLVAAVTVWSATVAARVPEAASVWEVQTMGRVSGTLGREPIWFYCVDVMTVLLPWTPLVLLAAPASWNAAWRHFTAGALIAVKRRSFVKLRSAWIDAARKDDARQRFLWTWFLVQFAILSSMSAKHQHYLAATLPMLALLAGRGFEMTVRRLASGQFDFGRNLTLAGVAVVALLSVGSAVILARRFPELVPYAVALGSFMAIGGIATIVLVSRTRLVAAGHTLIAAFVLCSTLATSQFVPADDHRRAGAEFAREMRLQAGPDTLLCSYALGPDPVVYYLGGPVRRVDTREDLDALLHEHRTLRIVTSAVRREELESLGDVSVRGESVEVGRGTRVARLIDAELTELQPTLPAPRLDVRYATEPTDGDKNAAERR